MASPNARDQDRGMVIAIDGPAGAGKSTVARTLAHRLHATYLDTGAMYRAVTLKALQEKTDLHNEEQLIDVATRATIDIVTAPDETTSIFLDGKDVTADIRSTAVTDNTHYIAQVPGVRAVMVERQRQIAAAHDVVVEGRDIGTVVFPHATRKFYLDADVRERSQRRIKELKEKGAAVNEDALHDSLRQRDTRDLTRAVGPLKQADDAIRIDSTNLSIEAVVEAMVRYIPTDG